MDVQLKMINKKIVKQFCCSNRAARKLENMLKSNRIKHNINKQGQKEKLN